VRPSPSAPAVGRVRRLAGLLLCVGLGLFAGIGLYTFWYAEGASYFSNDPRACVNCHVMRDAYDGWQHASHHTVATCNDCHTPHAFVPKYTSKALNGFFHSKAFTLQDFPEPIRITPRNARVLQENCVDCHRTLASEILGHDTSPQDMTNCVRCHLSVGHGPPR
jgi:cytochrome c nitrite reductase small subunit